MRVYRIGIASLLTWPLIGAAQLVGKTFYSGELFPHWRGDLFVAALGAKRLLRLLVSDGRVVAEEPLLLERCERMSSVNEGPDGALYVLTDEDAGRILRIEPAARALP